MDNKTIKLVQCDFERHGRNQGYEYKGKLVTGDIFYFERYTKEVMRYFRFNKDGSPEWLDWFDLEYFGGRIKEAYFIFEIIEDEDGNVTEALYDKL